MYIGDILDELTNPLVDASRTALNTDLPHSLLGGKYIVSIIIY